MPAPAVLNQKLHLLLISGALLLYIAAGALIPPGMFSDSGSGFLIWQSMKKGACFNCGMIAAPGNIAETLEYKLTWWTPGQYLVPGLIQAAAGTSLGTALLLTCTVATVLGLLGCYRLFIVLGFAPGVSSASVAFLAMQRLTSLPFNIYTGGCVLVFAVLPWALVFTFRRRNWAFTDFLLVWLAAVTGFYMKSSMLISFAGLLAAAGAFELSEAYRSAGELAGWTRLLHAVKLAFADLVKLGVLSAAVLASTYFMFSHGSSSPASPSRFNPGALDVLVPLAAPLVGLFSLDQIYMRIFQFPGHTLDIVPEELLHAAAFAVLVVFLLRLRRQQQVSDLYRVVFLAMYAVYTAFFVITYTFDAAISYESRHFRILAILLTPALFKYLHDLPSRSKTRILGWALVTACTAYGVLGCIQRAADNRSRCTYGKHGFCHAAIDKRSLELLHSLDRKASPDRSVIYVTSALVGLEVERARLMVTDAQFTDLSKLRSLRYGGTVEELTLFLAKVIGAKKIEAIQASFVDYESFTAVAETDSYLVLKGAPRRPQQPTRPAIGLKQETL